MLPNMGVRDLLLSLWVLSAGMQTSQASLRLLVSPHVTAACGQSVTLHCNVSTHHGALSVKHLSWNHNNRELCKVEGAKLINSETSRVHCDYADKSLSVTFLQSRPQKNRPWDEYSCKLRSNQETQHNSTRVHVKECTEHVTSSTTTDGPSCTFTAVFPDNEVHWYQNQTRFPQHNIKTQESVDKDCCVTLNSSLNVGNPSGSYRCFLWHNETKNYTASKLVEYHLRARLDVPTPPSGNLGLRGSIGSIVIVSVLLMSL